MSLLLTLMAMPFALTSCGNDEPDNDFTQGDSRDEENKEEEPEVTLTYAKIKKIVSENVTCKAWYANYMFTFTLTSELKTKLPNEKIEYGIGHDSADGLEEISVSIGKDAYEYSSKRNGDIETITFKIPFWHYYLFVNRDDDISVESGMYYATYKALTERDSSDLSRDDKELLKAMKGYLSSYELNAKKDYRPIVYVIVNNRFYSVGRYKITDNS